MIKVSFTVDSDGVLRYTAKGHAGSNRYADLICAGVSAIDFGIAQNVKTASGNGDLKRKPKIVLRKGNSQVIFQPTKESFNKLAYMLTCFQKAILVLAANHPDAVSLNTLDMAAMQPEDTNESQA